MYIAASSSVVSLEDLETLWRPLTEAERPRAEALLEVVYATLEAEASKVGCHLTSCNNLIVKSVIVDVVARTLMTSTNQEPMTQMSQSAGGYSTSGTFLVPGGGIFIKKSELARLGLRRQRGRMMDIYGTDNW